MLLPQFGPGVVHETFQGDQNSDQWFSQKRIQKFEPFQITPCLRVVAGKLAYDLIIGSIERHQVGQGAQDGGS